MAHKTNYKLLKCIYASSLQCAHDRRLITQLEISDSQCEDKYERWDLEQAEPTRSYIWDRLAKMNCINHILLVGDVRLWLTLFAASIYALESCFTINTTCPFVDRVNSQSLLCSQGERPTNAYMYICHLVRGLEYIPFGYSFVSVFCYLLASMVNIQVIWRGKKIYAKTTTTDVGTAHNPYNAECLKQ